MEGEIELRKKFLLVSNVHLEKATTWLLLINQNDLSWYEHLLFSLCSCRTPLQGLAVLFNWIFLLTPSQLTGITYQSPRNNRKTKLRSEMMELERLLSRLPTYDGLDLLSWQLWGSCLSLNKMWEGKCFSSLRAFKFETTFLLLLPKLSSSPRGFCQLNLQLSTGIIMETGETSLSTH